MSWFNINKLNQLKLIILNNCMVEHKMQAQVEHGYKYLNVH